MHRLNDRAYQLLAAEVKRLVNSRLESVRRDIVLRRLHKLKVQEGAPATYAELKATVEDIFPEFDDAILRQAAKVNANKVGKLGLIRNVAIGTAVAAGSLWFLNLPYPMIRWPVSRVAPMVLLPSFMGMDHHYRQAISLVEQADQLVNQATSAADIRLGHEKVQAAQNHLDQLPVWFLGYYPSRYCTFFSCTWRFTYDEFESARKAIGRMEAKLFQEDNAVTQLDASTAAIEAAKQAYTAATEPDAKQTAIADWQAGIDQLNEIPSATWAGKIAQTKLTAYQRDLEQVAGIQTGDDRASRLMQAAKDFAWTASLEAKNPPLRPENWKRIATLWQTAIDRLNQVPVEDANYVEAQRMLAEYSNKLGAVQNRLDAETRSIAAFESAQRKNTDLANMVSRLDANQYAGYLQDILNDLNQVETGTTVYDQSQQLADAVEQRLTTVAP